ncbi:MAG: adenylyltransferase/cytidyltransferase family protein [Candidatus Latescibacteria bacterium]|nr:adenylyltransferase/cytidyltransferase family protein [Candidatus Latescibacterota bacterium]
MTSSKIVPIETIEERLRSAPATREGLVLANGIFDLLHVGHVRYLEGAKAAGKRLLVAVNADASARKLKGPGRPLLPLEERMEIVAALACVDWVTWFDEPSAEEVLRRIRPALHAKGTDYTTETVPERAVAESLGVRTIIVGDPKQHGSSDMIRRIRLGLRADPGGTQGG